MSLLPAFAQNAGDGKYTPTYHEIIDFYQNLSATDKRMKLYEMGPTDAGYPLHLLIINNQENFEMNSWKDKVTILINNGIHPGEPDGIDATIRLLSHIHNGKVKLPDNIVLAVIPVYNIGGCLNRNSFSRVNQDGPDEYGFRGNSRNLDLNRDFTKCDSREAASFAEIFHMLKPHILVDTHVSDGADFQHTMTLITTQYEKLGPVMGPFLKNTFEPALYKGMNKKGWDMIPYLHFNELDLDKGKEMFYDAPRYSSGYAAMFHTLSFMPETHMLKPYADRVRSTYDLLNVFINEASSNANELITLKEKAIGNENNQKRFPLNWQVDTTKFSSIPFKGYEQEMKISTASGLETMFYNKERPISVNLKFFDFYKPIKSAAKPKAYIIPRGWAKIAEKLKAHGIKVDTATTEQNMHLTIQRINTYKTFPFAFEGHYKHYEIETTHSVSNFRVSKGDYIIYTDQPGARFIIEMLEPAGEDSYFAWNFFDAILQQKEGYSDYRWDEIAGEVLKNSTDLQKKLRDRKESDTAFAKDHSAILDFIYKNSPYYEPEHMRYPVFRLEFE